MIALRVRSGDYVAAGTCYQQSLHGGFISQPSEADRRRAL